MYINKFNSHTCSHSSLTRSQVTWFFHAQFGCLPKLDNSVLLIALEGSPVYCDSETPKFWLQPNTCSIWDRCGVVSYICYIDLSSLSLSLPSHSHLLLPHHHGSITEGTQTHLPGGLVSYMATPWLPPGPSLPFRQQRFEVHFSAARGQHSPLFSDPRHAPDAEGKEGNN